MKKFAVHVERVKMCIVFITTSHHDTHAAALTTVVGWSANKKISKTIQADTDKGRWAGCGGRRLFMLQLWHQLNV